MVRIHFLAVSVPIGDGGNPSPSGEVRCGVTWSRATLQTGRAHERRPKGSSGMDSEISEIGADWRRSSSSARSAAADRRRTRAGDRVWESAGDHVHLFISYRPNQPVSQMVQWLKGISSRILLQEFRHLRKKFWGKHLWARGYLAVSPGTIIDQMIREYIDEQEGEQIADDSRFPIDNA